MPNRHLTLSYIYCIQNLLKLGYSNSKIATKMSFSITAIINEISRNSIKNTYCAKTAHKLYLSRKRSNNNKLTDRAKKLIIELLKKKISPELICGRLKHQSITSVCFKTVYNFIYKYQLKHYLFFKGKRYKYKKEGESKQGKISDRVNISEWPQVANDRKELYHFEGDTIVGKDHKGAIVTMVDRVSRFTILGKSKDRTASSINHVLFYIRHQIVIRYLQRHLIMATRY